MLASDNLDIVNAALTTLGAFLRRSAHRSLRWQADPVLVTRLFALAQSVGTKEEARKLGFFIVLFIFGAF